MTAVASLHVHPVKSCRGIAVTEAALDRFGLVGDRRFLVVDEHGRFITQRTLPRLALVEPGLHEGTLTLTAPGMPPMRMSAEVPPGTPRLAVEVWRDTVAAVDLGAAAADWLAVHLGRPARLVAMAPEFSRAVAKPSARPGDETAFTDGFPVLVISEASLDDLNDRLVPDLDALPMDRFRPNLVVRGCPAFAEDAWRRIRIGEVVLRAAGPCARCVVTTTDQRTLERGREPLRTLAQYRRSPDGDVNFGQNYIHESKSGLLRVGMPVEVLE